VKKLATTATTEAKELVIVLKEVGRNLQAEERKQKAYSLSPGENWIKTSRKVARGNELLSVICLLSRICLCRGKFKHEANVITALLASGTEINVFEVKCTNWT
jgi:hypothetical protein